jgi:uncharacterized protein (TIGR00255 family)
MICSMTGYGDAELTTQGVRYSAEIRSVNNRYFKASVKLPDPFAYLEPDIERLLRERLGRGSVTYALRLRSVTGIEAYEINVGALERYVRQLQPLAALGAQIGIELGSTLSLPGVSQPPQLDETQKQRQWDVVRQLSAQVLDKVVAMRAAEGRALRADLLAHCQAVLDQLETVRLRAPDVIREYHQRLAQRVAELTGAAELNLDADVLAREVALYAERSDISEEVARLASHVQQFRELCESNELAGRKLEFLSQEMLREANTIASKSNDVQIARGVIEIKASIDRLKEQTANVA